jgi:hypothetical protein
MTNDEAEMSNEAVTTMSNGRKKPRQRLGLQTTLRRHGRPFYEPFMN